MYKLKATDGLLMRYKNIKNIVTMLVYQETEVNESYFFKHWIDNTKINFGLLLYFISESKEKSKDDF